MEENTKLNEIQDEIQGKINALKILLKDSDYVACKIAEGVVKDGEYDDILTKRQEWRNLINDYEVEYMNEERAMKTKQLAKESN